MGVPLRLPVVKPLAAWVPARTFGIPRGRPGRGGYEIQAIIIHCVTRPMEHSAPDAARRYRDQKARPQHTTLHYVINGAGAIQQYVADADIAHAMLWYDGNFPAPYPLDITWTVADANPGVTPDYYTVNIGVEQPEADIAGAGCTGCEELVTGEARSMLVQLLAWLCETYNIPADAEHIVLHRDIDAAAVGECGECVHLDDIVQEVAAYCQPCAAPFSNNVPPGDIVQLLGLSDEVCGVRCVVHEDAVGLLRRLIPLAPSGGLVWTDDGLALAQ